MTENREKIEKISRSATNLLTWLNKNIKYISKKYTFEEMKQRPIKIIVWLENNCLAMDFDEK